MSRHILLTGGAGFIGTNAAHTFLSRGDRVTVLDSFARPSVRANAEWLSRQHGDNLTIVEADIRDPVDRLRDLVENATVVWHLAGQVAVTSSIEDPVRDFDVNARGTLNLLESVRASDRRPIFVYSSTNKVYGSLSSLGCTEKKTRYTLSERPAGIDESQPLDFHSPYGCSKGAGDQYTLDYARVYGLATVVMRQSCIYGPHQHGGEDQGWIAWFARRALQDAPVTIFGTGKQVRDALYVDDLIQAFDAAVDRIEVTSGEAYNIGGGFDRTLSLLELVARLEVQLGRIMRKSFEDSRPGDQRVYVSDCRKAERDFGWQPRTTIDEGLPKLLSWLADANRQGSADGASRQAAPR